MMGLTLIKRQILLKRWVKTLSLILKSLLHCFGKEIEKKKEVHQSFSLTIFIAKDRKAKP